jgi:hypothetical protein
MSANVARNKIEYFVLIFILMGGLCGYLLMWHLDWEESSNLKKIQSYKLKNGETLKTKVENMFPGGVWNSGEFYSGYENALHVFSWAIENDRVLAASVATIEMFPELSPQIDPSVLDTLHKDSPFDPFQFEHQYLEE